MLKEVLGLFQRPHNDVGNAGATVGHPVVTELFLGRPELAHGGLYLHGDDSPVQHHEDVWEPGWAKANHPVAHEREAGVLSPVHDVLALQVVQYGLLDGLLRLHRSLDALSGHW